MQRGKAVCIMACTKPTLTSLEARAFSTFPVKMQKCFDKIFVISIKKTFRLYWTPSLVIHTNLKNCVQPFVLRLLWVF